jgi:hypothetical protein
MSTGNTALTNQSTELVNHIDNEKRILELEKQVIRSEHKAVVLQEKINMWESSPELAKRKAELEFDLSVARQFCASGAFKFKTPEEVYVVIKAGEEMGLNRIESLQSLYIINGSIKFYGDKMISRISSKGYKIEYLDETKDQVTVRVSKGDFDVKETAKITDQIMQKSNAAKFASENKLRFHAIRKIASFHLPHLFTAVANEFTSDYTEVKEERLLLTNSKDIEAAVNAIQSANDRDEANEYFNSFPIHIQQSEQVINELNKF